MKMDIKLTPIDEQKVFTKKGWLFTFIAKNKELNLYLYRRETEGATGDITYWEVVRPVKRKNQDGEIIEIYPSSELFGVYGKCTKDLKNAVEYFSNGF